MIISNRTKLYKTVTPIAESKEPKHEQTIKSEGIYYKAKSKKDGAIINFNVDLFTYRYNFKTKVLQQIPNPFNVVTSTYMSNLNKLFEVYENEATAKKFEAVTKIADNNDRYLELEALIKDKDFRQFCITSKYSKALMIACNFYNHVGLSHGKTSGDRNKKGISNFRDKGIENMNDKLDLSDWLKGNPSAVARVESVEGEVIKAPTKAELAKAKKAKAKAKAKAKELLEVTDETITTAENLTDAEIEALTIDAVDLEREPTSEELAEIANSI